MVFHFGRRKPFEGDKKSRCFAARVQETNATRSHVKRNSESFDDVDQFQNKTNEDHISSFGSTFQFPKLQLLTQTSTLHSQIVQRSVRNLQTVIPTKQPCMTPQKNIFPLVSKDLCLWSSPENQLHQKTRLRILRILSNKKVLAILVPYLGSLIHLQQLSRTAAPSSPAPRRPPAATGRRRRSARRRSGRRTPWRGCRAGTICIGCLWWKQQLDGWMDGCFFFWCWGWWKISGN